MYLYGFPSHACCNFDSFPDLLRRRQAWHPERALQVRESIRSAVSPVLQCLLTLSHMPEKTISSVIPSSLL